MPSRLNSLENLLQEAHLAGYKVLSIGDFIALSRAGKLNPDSHYLMLRHDIDTDVATAKAMWQLESKLGFKATFFFRLLTADISLMNEIHNGGGEVGYHFEEIATVAKNKGLKGTSNLGDLIKDAGELFCKNLALLRRETGIPLRGIAAHGDFVNRKLGIVNHELLTPEIRQFMNIDYEAYDEELVNHLSSRFSDLMYPRLWKPVNPLEAVKRGDHVIKLLIHPRQWQSSPWVNTKETALRMYEGARYWAA